MTPAFAHRLPRAVTYRAWRLAGDLISQVKAVPLDLDDPDSLEEALGQLSSYHHKDTVFVHEVDGVRRRATLHGYRVQQGAAEWRKNAETGRPERQRPLKLHWLFSLPVDAFCPSAPFDALKESASGVDHTLIQGDAA